MPISALQRRQRRRRAPQHAPGTTARRCSSSSRRVEVAARPQPRRRALAGAVDGPRGEHATTAATPARSPAASLRAGDEVVVLPARRALDGRARSTRPTGRSTAPSPPMSVDRAARGRRSTSAAATCSSTPGDAPAVARAARGDGLLDGRGAAARGRALPAQAHHAPRARDDRARSTRRVDIAHARRAAAPDELGLNDIGRVRAAHRARRCSPTRTSATAPTGAFILIDERTHDTVGAGMIESRRARTSRQLDRTPDVIWHAPRAGRARALVDARRARRDGLAHRPAGVGQVDDRRRGRAPAGRAGRIAYLLDGDNMRHGLSGDLGFAPPTAHENAAASPHVARLFADAGRGRARVAGLPVRARTARSRASCTSRPGCRSSRSSSTRRSRSASGATRRACTRGLARVSCPASPASTAPYEAPEEAELVVRPMEEPVADAVERLLARLDAALDAAG